MAVNHTHALTADEIILLNSLIGKTLTGINYFSRKIIPESKVTHFEGPLYLQFKTEKQFTSLSAKFSETNFGEDFIRINLTDSINSIPTKFDSFDNLLHPFSMGISPDFIIQQIEIYGWRYSVISDGSNPVWKIELDNPGHIFQEDIEIENILLFIAKDGRRLLFEPQGPAPWIVVHNNETESINVVLDTRNSDGQNIIFLKQSI